MTGPVCSLCGKQARNRTATRGLPDGTRACASERFCEQRRKERDAK